MKLRDTLKLARVTILAACGLFATGAFAQPLAGVGTVPGTAPDGFPWLDLNTAINDLDTSGVLVGGGGVTITLLPASPQTAPAGGYIIGRNTIGGVAGSSAVDPIIINGGGNTITANAAHTIGAINDAVFKIVGTDFCTLTNFTITEDNVNNNVLTVASNDMTEFGVALFYATVNDGCTGNTISNNTISLNRLYTNSFGVYSNTRHSATSMTTTADITSTGGSNSGNTVTLNTISNVNMGVTFIGSGFLAVYQDVGNNVSFNNISNWGGAAASSSYVSNTGTSYCIFMNHQWGANVANNTLTSAAVSGTAVTFRGIVHDYTTLAPAGNGLTTNINNNTITMTSGFVSGTFRAIDCVGGVNTMSLDVTGNTVLNCAITGAASSSLLGGIFNSGALNNVNMNNNIVRGNTSTATTGGFTGIQNTGAAIGAINMNGNQIGNASGNAITYSVATSGALLGISNTGGTTTTSLSQSNNDFRGIVYNVLSSATTTGLIQNTAACLNTNINNNTFTNLSMQTTGSVTMIANSVTRPANAVCNANNNSIVTAFAKTGGGGTLTLYNSFGFTTAANTFETNTGNTFNNITVAGATAIGGWISDDGSSAGTAPQKNVSNNSFTNWTSATGSVTGLRVNNSSSNGLSVVENNTISGFTSAGLVTGLQSTGGRQNIRNNVVSNLTCTGANLCRGMLLGASTAGTNLVHRNRICNLQGNLPGSTVNGINITSISTGFNLELRNNLIGDLKAPTANADNAVIGINATTTIGNLNLYFNTIQLAATSTGSSFGSSGVFANTGHNLTMNNNIIVNNSAQAGIGMVTAYRRSSTTNGTYQNASNRNLFWAGTPGVFRTIHFDGTNSYQTLADYMTYIGPIRDANAATENPPFISTSCGNVNFLHLSGSTVAESGGANIAPDSVDYDNQVRQGFVTYSGTSTIAPDIGADEFNGTNPNLCSGTPTAGSITVPDSTRCQGQPSQTMTLVGATTGIAGITYQWQSSTTSGGPYGNLGTGLTQATGTITDTTYYICIVTCGLSGLSDSTAQLQIIVNPNPTAAATNDGPVCTGDTIELHATACIQQGAPPTPSYCVAGPFFSSGCGIDYISNVTFAGINNSGTCSGAAPTGYNNFTAGTPAAVTPGSTYSLSVTTGGDTEGIAVWIDWDNDGTFAAGELVLNGYLGTNPATYTNASVLAPLSLTPGSNVRMRVRCEYFGDPSAGTGPCGSTTWGEIEDYRINVAGSLPCTPVAATFAWTGPATYTATGSDPIRMNALLTHAGAYNVIATYGGCASPSASTTVAVFPGVDITAMTATPNPMCEGGSTQLSFTATGLGSTGSYCTAPHTTGTGSGDYCTLVQITGTTLNNPTGASPSPYYTLYPASGATTATLTAGSPYSITLSTGTYSFNDIAAWIDFNNDFDFVDAGEKLGETDNLPSGGSTTINFTVPAGAINGATRLRVRETDQGTTGGMLPCSSMSWGETEDYTVTIQGGVNVGTFTWTPATYLDNAAIASPTASGVPSNITYSLNAANAGGCSDTASIAITVNPAVDAGLDGSNTVCSLDPTFDMFTFLGGTPDAGGFWLDPSDNGHSNMFDPAVDAGGCYKYVVPALAPCSNDTALVCVTNNIAPTYYADQDFDGFGDPATDSVACTQPAGYVSNNTDLCPLDPLKQAPGICGCGVSDVDSDSDGYADCIDSCPLVFGIIGSYCNDGNPATINDQLDGSCNCVGIPNPCTANAGVLTMETDGNGLQTSWEIIPQGGGTPLCGGTGFPNNSTIVLTCCLNNGCYELRVLDSFGDGMTTGGYVLRDGNNNRIIDNENDGVFTFTSQVSNNLGFCLPMGSDVMAAGSCDNENLLSSSLVSAVPNPAVSAQFGVGVQTDDGYQYWIFNPDGGYNRRITLNHTQGAGPAGPTRCATLSLSSIVTFPVPQYVLLNIRVRGLVNGVFNEFGPACRMKINPNIPCVATQLTTTATPVISCGQTGVIIAGGVLWANNVTYANKYQFQFSRPGYLRNVSSNTRALTLSVWSVLPLQCGLTYDVKVRPSYDGGITWCPFGTICQITTENCAPFAGGSQHIGTQNSTDGFTMWPNPNRDNQLYLAVEGLEEDLTTATVEINDLFGKLVRRETIALNGATSINTVMELDASMANGVYTVTVLAGQAVHTKRLVLE